MHPKFINWLQQQEYDWILYPNGRIPNPQLWMIKSVYVLCYNDNSLTYNWERVILCI